MCQKRDKVQERGDSSGGCVRDAPVATHGSISHPLLAWQFVAHRPGHYCHLTQITCKLYISVYNACLARPMVGDSHS